MKIYKYIPGLILCILAGLVCSLSAADQGGAGAGLDDASKARLRQQYAEADDATKARMRQQYSGTTGDQFAGQTTETQLRQQLGLDATKPIANQVPVRQADEMPEAFSATKSINGAQPSIESILRWTDRINQLPRLGQSVTQGKVAARGLTADYRIQAGDRLRIVTWGGTSMNEIVPVDASGNVGLPGYGAVPVGGQTVAQAQIALTELARSHFKQAGVLVGVEQAGAVSVTIVGGVENPGYHSIPAGSSVIDALSAAGGIDNTGTMRQVRLRAPGSDEKIIDLYDIAVDGAAQALQPITAGSLIVVPVHAPIVQVFGAVNREVAVEVLPEQTFAEVLRLCGGMAADADPAVVRLLREGPYGQELLQMSWAELSTIRVADGDRCLFVKRANLDQRRSVVVIDGQVRTPGRYAWHDGMTVGQLITFAGGLLPEADLAKAMIRRTRAEPQPMVIGEGVSVPSLFELVGPVSLDTPLTLQDLLVIPNYPPLIDSDLVVRIRGAVDVEGPQPYTPGLTVQQVLILAGGLRSTAQVDSADLVRVNIEADGDRTVSRQSFDLRPILAGAPGPELKPRDEIVIRERNDSRISVVVTGAIRNSGTFALQQGASLAEVIALAGGLTDNAFPHGIRLFRQSEVAAATEFIERLKQQLEAAVVVNQRTLLGGGSGDERDLRALQVTIAQQEAEIGRLAKVRATGRLLGIDFVGLLKDGHTEADVALQDGDIIDIPVVPGTLRIFGEIMNPGSLRFEPGLRVQTVIARSGGYTQQADRRRVFVVRADGAVVATAAGRGTAWDGAKRGWITTSIDTIDLVDGDTVIVPPDLEFKPSKLVVAKDLTQILFQIAIAAATVVAISG